MWLDRDTKSNIQRESEISYDDGLGSMTGRKQRDGLRGDFICTEERGASRLMHFLSVLLYLSLSVYREEEVEAKVEEEEKSDRRFWRDDRREGKEIYIFINK